MTHKSKIRIAEIRKHKGISQNELAYRSGISIYVIHQIEQGEIEPSLTMLRYLAFGLGVATIDLLPVEDWIRPSGKFAACPKPTAELTGDV